MCQANLNATTLITVRSRLRAGLAGGLQQLQHIMLNNGKLLDDTSKVSCEHYYILFREALNKLALKAEENKQLRYHLRPKLHHLEHLILDHCRQGRNYRYTSCYLGEDMVRLMKRMALKLHPLVCGTRAIDHYALHVCLKWAGLLDE